MTAKTQQERVEEVLTGPDYWTLEEIADACKVIFKKSDSQAAISARYRDCAKPKHKRIRGGKGQLWEYRILEKHEYEGKAA